MSGVQEVPAHLELYGHVVVEVLGGFGDGIFDDGATGCRRFAGCAGVVDVDALVGGGFSERDGIDGGGGDTLGCGIRGGAGVGWGVRADSGELAEDAGERSGKRLEAEVGEPEAQVELIGHRLSL